MWHQTGLLMPHDAEYMHDSGALTEVWTLCAEAERGRAGSSG